VKIYLQKNVREAALDRIRFLFDEFPHVVVNVSGGKDSTIVYNLALQVAEEKGRLPLPVLFVDQEAEWGSVIDSMRLMMSDPRVLPLWYQMPLKLFNATSTTAPWLMCWEPGAEWMREKEPNSITENRYGTDRFKELFGAIMKADYKGEKACYLAGVRAEESPQRFVGLTQAATYKHVTYGSRYDARREHFCFYPIYDWAYSDVWKAIHDNAWPYCKLYDAMYQHGVPLQKMRVSNVHHETAVDSLYILQEIESETWSVLTARLSGINSAGQGKRDMFVVETLPRAFSSWIEYRDYLLENLITDPEYRSHFRRKFAALDAEYVHEKIRANMAQNCIQGILRNDYEHTVLGAFERRPEVNSYRLWRRGKPQATKFIPTAV